MKQPGLYSIAQKTLALDLEVLNSQTTKILGMTQYTPLSESIFFLVLVTLIKKTLVVV
jgi:hypothetical protein